MRAVTLFNTGLHACIILNIFWDFLKSSELLGDAYYYNCESQEQVVVKERPLLFVVATFQNRGSTNNTLSYKMHCMYLFIHCNSVLFLCCCCFLFHTDFCTFSCFYASATLNHWYLLCLCYSFYLIMKIEILLRSCWLCAA